MLADKVPFDDFFFKYIFRFGLSEPVKSWSPEGKFNVSLIDFMDYALMVALHLLWVSWKKNATLRL